MKGFDRSDTETISSVEETGERKADLMLNQRQVTKGQIKKKHMEMGNPHLKDSGSHVRWSFGARSVNFIGQRHHNTQSKYRMGFQIVRCC